MTLYLCTWRCLFTVFFLLAFAYLLLAFHLFLERETAPAPAIVVDTGLREFPRECRGAPNLYECLNP